MKLVEVIEDSLYESFKSILVRTGHKNTQVVFDKENGLEPKNTYLVISILDRESQGRTNRSTFLTKDAEMWWMEHFTLCLQLTFVGKSASSIAWDVDDSLPASINFLEEFQKRNLGYLSKSKLRRNPQPRESGWMDAWALDIDLSFAIQSRQVMDWVEFITIDGELFRIHLPDLEDRTVEDDSLRTTEDGFIREFLPDSTI